jgi:hypothetical protein
MNKYFTVVAASLITGTTFLLAAAPATATSIDINIGVPHVVVQPQPVYVQPRPIYIQPQYEHDWRERQVRAAEWRADPHNHGHAVSAAAHVHSDARKSKHKKHHGKNKHGH